MDRAGTVALARDARRFLVKVGSDTVRLDASGEPLGESVVVRYLLHEDGFLRVPVLVAGDLLVRGFTEALYREALDMKGVD